MRTTKRTQTWRGIVALAAALCGVVILAVPQSIPARFASAWHNNMGVLALGLKPSAECPCLDRAVGWFERAIQQDQRNARPYFGLGQVHLARGDTRGAIHAFEEAVAHSGGDPLAYFYLGVALEEAGLDEEAMASMLRAGNSQYPVERMDYLISVGEERRAGVLMQAALAAGVDSGLLYLRLGMSYANAGRWEEAGEPLRLALEANPDSGMAQQKWLEYMRVMRSSDVRP